MARKKQMGRKKGMEEENVLSFVARLRWFLRHFKIIPWKFTKESLNWSEFNFITRTSFVPLCRVHCDAFVFQKKWEAFLL